jgi:hypothetical protein
MKHPDAKLGDLFPVSAEEVKERLSSALSSDKDAKELPNHLLQMALGEAAKRFAELLEVSLVDIMAGAWYKYAALVQYTDRRKHPPEESILVELGKHSIDSAHSPRLEVLVGDRTVVRLKLDVKLSMEIKSAILRIQNGRIKEIRAGEVRAEGKVKFGDVVLAERKSSAVRLPGSIDLGDGIEIIASGAAD